MSDPATYSLSPVTSDSEYVDRSSSIEPSAQQVLDTIRRMIARGAALEIKQVRPGDENLPPPNGLYSTVRLIGDSSPVDSDASAYFVDDPDSNDHYLIANQYRDNWASWSIQFFRNGSALSRLRRARAFGCDRCWGLGTETSVA